MQPKKTNKNTSPVTDEAKFAIPRKNVYYLLIGLGVVALGFLLMLGGKAQSPNEFEAKVLFSFPRMVLAPIIICAGFAFEVVAIMKIGKKK